MRFLLLILLFCSVASAQVRLVSWNVQNLGKSKSDSIIAYIAHVVKDADIVALQEVVAGPGGAQTVARLVNQLNRTGTKWDYTVSPATSGSAGSERYAYLWKPSVVQKVGDAALNRKFEVQITREPFLCTFTYKKNHFTIVSLHAVPKKKQPETEIKYLKFFPVVYPDKQLIFVGDFNCPQSHSVFNPLKKLGYVPVLQNQKTTLKMACRGSECLASEYDNIWLPASVTVFGGGITRFYKDFSSMKAARKISDHVPVSVLFAP